MLAGILDVLRDGGAVAARPALAVLRRRQDAARPHRTGPGDAARHQFRQRLRADRDQLDRSRCSARTTTATRWPAPTRPSVSGSARWAGPCRTLSSRSATRLASPPRPASAARYGCAASTSRGSTPRAPRLTPDRWFRYQGRRLARRWRLPVHRGPAGRRHRPRRREHLPRRDRAGDRGASRCRAGRRVRGSRRCVGRGTRGVRGPPGPAGRSARMRCRTGFGAGSAPPGYPPTSNSSPSCPITSSANCSAALSRPDSPSAPVRASGASGAQAADRITRGGAAR